MTTPPPQPRPPGIRRRRLSIDVYFVLYLTAIVLLLGTAPLARDAYQSDLEDVIIRLIDTRFSVEVEQIGMYIPAAEPSPVSGVSIASTFSADTVNAIRATGSFERVRFRILEVVDTLSGTSGDPESALLMRRSDSTALFIWTDRRPRQQAVYLVRIEGVATPRIPASVDDPDLREHIARILEERNLLRDTAEFYVNVLSLQDIIAEAGAQQAPGFSTGEDTAATELTPDEIIQRFLQQSPLRAFSPFSAVVASPQIYTDASGRWIQRVGIAGVDPESVSILSPSGVSITGRYANAIDVSGSAPAAGSQSVRLTLGAAGDESVSVEFEVRAVSVDAPTIPRIMYANTEYDIDLRSGQIDPRRMTVRVNEGGATVREGLDAQFRYRPSRSSGTGEFVRLVDGRAFDSWRFTISEIPDPELVRVRDYGDSVIVQSVSWGEFNGRVNRSIVAIKEGQNVEEPRLVDEEVDRQTYQITRTWSIRRLDAGRKSGFVLRAWDQRGLSHSTDLSIAGTSPR